jgi:hypothetical protein
MRVAVEAVLERRYKLRMMGIQIEDTTNVLSDNQAVVINTQFPSSNLKKKHNAVAYHKCREAVAAGIVRTGHIPSKDNIADVLTESKADPTITIVSEDFCTDVGMTPMNPQYTSRGVAEVMVLRDQR